ncbi:serine--tRNA ligase [Anaerolineae bacterium CFX7]|nr:serine--tRNA ligase [Anaerolineae bacterium CFX7]
MNDIRLIREKPDLMRDALGKRQMETAPVERLLALDEERRAKLAELETFRAQRNAYSKEIGRLTDAARRETLKDQVRVINIQIDELETLVGEFDAQLQEALYELPNIPDADVPFGKDDSENVVVKTVGAPREFAFTPQPHYELGPKLGYLDFERGVKLAGTRFYVTNGPLAKLQRSLIQWLLDHHIARGYREFGLPFMVKEDIMLGAGQLPKFRENLYHDVERDAWFVPTAEVPLTGLHMGDILDGDQLPLNYTAYTPCFRKENLAAGKDTRGIKRGFQFDKVEMYKYCKPEASENELNNMVADIESALTALEIPYRIKQLCTGDLGFGSAKTFDLEVWAPGINEWLEVSSASNVRDFQARRGNIRFRRERGAKPEFVHTLNGSGLGIPRTMIALIENYQQADGSLAIPQALREYTKADAIR